MTSTDASRRDRIATVALGIVIAIAGGFAGWATNTVDPWLRWLGGAAVPAAAFMVVMATLAQDVPEVPPWHDLQPDPPADTQPDPVTARLERMVPAASGRSGATTAEWTRTLEPLLTNLDPDRLAELTRSDHEWTRSDLDEVLRHVPPERSAEVAP